MNIEEKISELSHPLMGSFLNPAPSCQLMPQDSPSGHYWIQNAGTGYANLEYCDMTRRCCNSTGGWMRVAHLDMTDTNQHCPSGFRLITSPKRTCGTPGSRCVSTTFPLNGVKYSRVCGKIIGYQYASVDAFDPYYLDRSHTIDSLYVDGVSLTHGQRPRKHIWTFAAAFDETRSNQLVCPCTKINTLFTGVVPPFIGQDYFCETGSILIKLAVNSTMQTPFGMAQAVVLPVVAVASTTHPGSVNNYHNQPLMTLRCGCV